MTRTLRELLLPTSVIDAERYVAERELVRLALDALPPDWSSVDVVPMYGTMQNGNRFPVTGWKFTFDGDAVQIVARPQVWRFQPATLAQHIHNSIRSATGRAVA
jgi:hypothetical protein